MAYKQSINNTVVNQILYNHPYDDYVVYREDANNYVVVTDGTITFDNNTYTCSNCTAYYYYTGSGYSDPVLTVTKNRNMNIQSDIFVYSSLNNNSLKLKGVENEQTNYILFIMFFFAFTFLLFDKCIFRHTSNR